MKIDLEKILKGVPVVYSFLVFCGAIYWNIYYSYFHINIFQYFELSEILVSFINNLIWILIVFAIITLQNLIVGIDFPNEGKTRYGYNMRVFLVIVSILGAGAYIWFLSTSYIDSEKGRDFWWNTIAVCTILTCIFGLLTEWHEEGKEGITYMSIYLFIAFMTMITLWAYVARFNAIDPKKSQTISIVTQKDTITTTSNYLYIGRTHRYIFLYDASDKRTDVIPETEIKKISFKDK